MAEVEAHFQADMKAVTAIATLVGTQVYTYEAGKDAIDQYITIVPVTNMRGKFVQTENGGVARLSVYCNGRTAALAASVGNAVISEYENKSGTIGGTGGITAEWIEMGNARLLQGPGNHYRYLVDLVVHYH